MSDFDDQLHVLLQRVVGKQCQLLSAKRLSGGASQETYAIDTDNADGPRRFALRRAAGGGDDINDHGGTGLAVEALLMRLAAEHGVPEPQVLHVLEPDDQLGSGFLMTWVDGETLGARIARHDKFAAVRTKLAFQCGEILARIHAIDIAAHKLEQHLEVLTPESFVRQHWQRYQALETPQPMIDYTARWLLEHLPKTSAMTLVHNDFRNGNLMVDPTAGVCAVLDWEVAHIGDPMRDLGWICTPSWRFGVDEFEVGGFGHIDDLIAGYESVSGTRVNREAIHYWQVFGAFWWAVGCLFMAEHYRSGPDSSVERPGIGRRSSECQADCVNLLIPGPVAPLPTNPGTEDDNMPNTRELIESVRDFLREDVHAATEGRLKFLTRVAANSLDIVLRERDHDDTLKRREAGRLETLLSSTGSVEDLRWSLVRGLRDEKFALDDERLTAHLRNTVIAQLSLDQPAYPALTKALTDQRE